MVLVQSPSASSAKGPQAGNPSPKSQQQHKGKFPYMCISPIRNNKRFLSCSQRLCRQFPIKASVFQLMRYIYKSADCKLNVKATLLRSLRRPTGARNSRLLVLCCRKYCHHSFLMDVRLFIFMVYYLFNRMCISQLKVLRLGIRRLNLNRTEVSIGSVSIHMDNRFLFYWQRRPTRFP